MDIFKLMSNNKFFENVNYTDNIWCRTKWKKSYTHCIVLYLTSPVHIVVGIWRNWRKIRSLSIDPIATLNVHVISCIHVGNTTQFKYTKIRFQMYVDFGLCGKMWFFLARQICTNLNAFHRWNRLARNISNRLVDDFIDWVRFFLPLNACNNYLMLHPPWTLFTSSAIAGFRSCIVGRCPSSMKEPWEVWTLHSRGLYNQIGLARIILVKWAWPEH